MRDVVIIGVDPGLVSGVALYAGSHEHFHSFSGGRPEVIRFVESQLIAYPDVVVACERYTLGGRHKSQQPDALQLLGALEHITHAGGGQFRYQGAAEARRAGSDTVLRRLKWYVVEPDAHRNRAAAQVLLALATVAPFAYAKLVGGARMIREPATNGDGVTT